MESIYVTENPIDIGRFVNECNEMPKLKIGEIFSMNGNDFLMCCFHCAQEFHYFTEFTLHIQEHYRRGEIGQLVKEIDDGEECSDSRQNEIDKTIVSGPENDFMNDEFPLLDTDFELLNEPIDKSKLQNHANHIVLEPITAPNASFEPIQFVEGTDYEQENSHSYRCLICAHQSTAGWQYFRTHLLTHSSTPCIHCPICSKTFQNVSYVRKHVNRTHKLKITADKIRAAQSTFSGATPMDGIVSTTPETAEQSQQIGEPIKSFVEGEDYEKSNGRFKCLTCGREMLDHIKEHLLTHSNEKNVYCPLCDKAFIAVSYVRKHVNRAHKMKITAEEIKIAQTTIDTSIKSETKIDLERIRCPLRNDDKQTIKMTAVATMAQKNFECFECHRPFTGLNSLRIHLKLHSNSNSGIKYLCPYCEKLFAMRSYVRDHIVAMHGIKRDEIPKDSIRQATTVATTQSTVFSDSQSNANISFKCDQCQKTFETKQTLRQHIKTHTNGPFLCVICGVVYKSLANLRNHMERHQADPKSRHKCMNASCQKTYPTRRYMLNHYRSIHLQKGKRKKLKCNEIPLDSLNDGDEILPGKTDDVES